MGYDTVLLFLGCALATYVTRFGGHFILSRFGAIHHRVEAALNAVPVAVMAALVDLGVDAGRLTAVGMGEDYPIASNETDEGRSQNRRVDVILLDDQ